MPIISIDVRSVAALPVCDAPVVYFDQSLKGFGVRVMPSGVKTFVLEYRPGAGGRGTSKRRLTLGRDSEAFRADAARKKARIEAARVELGSDPAADLRKIREAATINDIVRVYLDEKIRPKRKPSTAVLFECHQRLYLSPELGGRKAFSVTRADMIRLHRRIGSTHRVTANRVVSMARAAFAYAIRNGLLPKDFQNPAQGIEPFREAGRERYLTAVELGRLGDALQLAESSGIEWHPDPSKKIKHAPRREHRRVIIDEHAVAAIRLLLFTGARLREVLHLKWQYVDLERGLLLLPDSKTGKKAIILGAPAMNLLRNLTRASEFVIAGRITETSDGKRVEKPRSDLNRPWARISNHAGLKGVRLHDLRHSFASVGAGAGLGLPIIGRLLGHADTATTARYAHLDADPLRRANDVISQAIEAALLANGAA